MDEMFAKWGGGEVLKKAVRGMLPKNRLRDKRLARLKVYEGESTPYGLNMVRFTGRKLKPSSGIVEGSASGLVEEMERMKIEMPPTKVGEA